MSNDTKKISINLDSILDSQARSIELNPEKIFEKHHEKKIKEQRGNKKIILAFIFAVLGVAFLDPDKFNLIHLSLFFVLGLINLWANESTRKKIENVDITTSFSEFADQRRLIAQASLKQFKIMRATNIIIITLAFGASFYRYIVTQDLIFFGLVSVLMAIGSFIALRASHQGVLEYQRLSKE